MKNNITSTENLINLSIKYEIKKFIFSSSASVYGNQKFFKNIKENATLKPINPYGKSKKICEEIIIKSTKSNRLEFCILRYFNVVGKNLTNKLYFKKNLNLFEKIYFSGKNNKVFNIFGKNLKTIDGTPVRDFISMYDLVNAHLECLKQFENKFFWNKVYNVGNNKGTTVLEIIKQFNLSSKKRIKFKIINNKKGEIDRSVANNKKFIKSCNWKPIKSDTRALVKDFYNL